MPMNHVQFRPIVISAWARKNVGPVPLSVIQITHAVSSHESSLGQGWKPPGVGSNNTGAVQSPNCNPETTFEYKDTHPNPDGTSTTYRVCFKKYASLEDGLVDQIRYQFKQPETFQAALRGDLWGVCAGMYKSGYFEGRGKDKQARIRSYYVALERNLKSITIALKEPNLFAASTTPVVPSTQPTSGNGATFTALMALVGVLRWLK